MTRTEAILQAVAAVLQARRADLDDQPLRSVLIEAKVNIATGEVRAALVYRRKIPVAERGVRVDCF